MPFRPKSLSPPRQTLNNLSQSLSSVLQTRGTPGSLDATMRDTVVDDKDNDDQADPGDVISYTVTITNNSGATINNAIYTATLPFETILGAGSISASPIAFNDTYTATGNMPIVVPVGNGLLSSAHAIGADVDPDGGSVALSSADATSAQGGSVTAMADGSFIYTPAVGFSGTDVFTYTITDDEGDTDSAQATILVTNIVWFVNGAAGGSNNGSFADPFQSIAALNSSLQTGTGDLIYIYAGTYSDGLKPKNSQTIVGQSVALSAEHPGLSPYAPTVPTSTTPTIKAAIGNGVDLAIGGNTLVALQIEDSAAHGIVASNMTGNSTLRLINFVDTGAVSDINNHQLYVANSSGDLAISTAAMGCNCGNAIQISGSTSDVTLTNVTLNNSGRAAIFLANNTGGSFAFNSGSFTHSGFEDAFDAYEQRGNVTIVPTITSTATQGGVRVQNSSATFNFGAVSITNAINRAILLNNNATATITFGGNVAITTSNAPGVFADNSGTLNFSGTANSVTAVGGAGIDITDTTLGSATTFANVSSSGSTVNGLDLDNVGSAGFTVNGGTITASTSGDGVRLATAGNIALKNVQVTNHPNNGIYASAVNNLTLDTVTVSGNGNESNEHGLHLTNLTGTSVIANTNVSNSAANDFYLSNTSGTLNLTVSNSSFINTSNGSFVANRFAAILPSGNANLTLAVSGSTFTGAGGSLSGSGIIAGVSSGLLDLTVNTSTFTNNSTAFSASASGTGNMTVRFDNNPTITGSSLTAVAVGAGPGHTGVVNARIQNNVIGTAGVNNSGSANGDGINIRNWGIGSLAVLVDNNTVQEIQFGSGHLCTGVTQQECPIQKQRLRTILCLQGLFHCIRWRSVPTLVGRSA